MRRVVVAVAVADLVVAGALVTWWASRPHPHRPAAAARWAALGPQARCDDAASLVTGRDPWPMVCRWRQPGDALEGQAFPPPAGDPPFDHPHIEVYVAGGQSRVEVAHAIAHELGHMRQTREPAFGPDWLAARGLPPDTPWQVWSEDYAEVFAALFAPPVEAWRAPTTRPDAAALAALKARFFA